MRTSAEVHRRLVMEAAENHVSLNQWAAPATGQRIAQVLGTSRSTHRECRRRRVPGSGCRSPADSPGEQCGVEGDVGCGDGLHAGIGVGGDPGSGVGGIEATEQVHHVPADDPVIAPGRGRGEIGQRAQAAVGGIRRGEDLDLGYIGHRRPSVGSGADLR
ncbi:toxin-antitoxin system HicB family antitoxin [Rhodococcus sp. C26F]